MIDIENICTGNIALHLEFLMLIMEWHMEFIRIPFKLMGKLFLAKIMILIKDEDGMPD